MSAKNSGKDDKKKASRSSTKASISTRIQNSVVLSERRMSKFKGKHPSKGSIGRKTSKVKFSVVESRSESEDMGGKDRTSHSIMSVLEPHESEIYQRAKIMRKSMSGRHDFFMELAYIPNLSDISLDVVDDVEELEEQTEKEDGKEPAAAETEQAQQVEPSSDFVGASSAGEDEESVEVESETEESKYSDLVIPSSSSEVAEPDAQLMMGDIEQFTAFFEPKRKETLEPATIEIDEAEVEAQQLRDHVARFLALLISKVVDRAEYKDPDEELAKNLDPLTLFHDLCIIQNDLKDEMLLNKALERNCVQHFRRRKKFREIKKESEELTRVHQEQFDESLTLLDELLGREVATREKVMIEEDTLRQTIEDLQAELDQNVYEFETIVRECFVRDNSPTLKENVERLLARMRRIRNKITEVRSGVIDRQHPIAVLKDQIQEFDNIGPNLHMRDFSVLQVEVNSLEKKIESKTNSINIMRERCHKNVELMSHMEENQDMLEKKVDILSFEFEQLIGEKYGLREHLYVRKTEHDRIRRDVESLTLQGGILHKPLLMFDYDDTCDEIAKMQETNSVLKKKLAQFQRSIELAEKLGKQSQARDTSNG